MTILLQSICIWFRSRLLTIHELVVQRLAQSLGEIPVCVMKLAEDSFGFGIPCGFRILDVFVQRILGLQQVAERGDDVVLDIREGEMSFSHV